jgi:hypothetical protein
MTIFEYIAVANSLILTLSVVRLIDALPSTFAPARRYWTHAAFVVSAMVGCAHYWWAGWRFASVSSWSQVDFLLFLAPPTILYAVARTLSSPDPNAVASFRDHFFTVHRRFYALSAIYQFTLGLSGWLILGIPLAHPFRLFQLSLLLLTLSGFFVANPRYHAFLAAVFLVSFAIAFGVVPQPPASG